MDLRVSQVYGAGGGQPPRQQETPVYGLKQSCVGPRPLFTPLQKQQQGPDVRLQQQRRSTSEKHRLSQSTGPGKPSAMASSAVKQRLQEFVLKKQEAALRNSVSQKALQPGTAYGCAAPGACNAPSRSQGTRNGEHEQDFPLRKTASEPNLKLRLKLKSRGWERRKGPLLRRKDSAPAGLGGGGRDHRDTSPNRSRLTPAPTSPKDALPTEAIGQSTGPEVYPIHQILVQEGALVPLPVLYTEPHCNISQGLPVHHRTKKSVGRTAGTRVLGFPSRVAALDLPLSPPRAPVPFLPPDRDPGSPRPQAPSFLGSAVAPGGLLPAMTALPIYYGPAIALTDCYPVRTHRPLGRTQSAPLPQNPRHVQQQLNYQRQHQQFLARLQQQTHLGKLMTKRHCSRDDDSKEVKREPAAGSAGVSPAGRGERLDPRKSAAPPEDGTPRTSTLDGSDLSLNQRLLLRDQPWISEPFGIHADAHIWYPGLGHRPLSRARSSPASASLPASGTEATGQSTCTTGLAYDGLMLKHQCSCGGGEHAERPGRIQSIWSRLQETGLRGRCQMVRGRKATLQELQSVHTEEHVLHFGTNPLNRPKIDDGKLLGILSQRTLVTLPCGGLGVDRDSVWNETHSANAARMAAGCAIELALKVARGELKNGFAIIRPPGHHAEPSAAMGFCFFNSVAIAARQLQLRSNVRKILIVDWDVHHGNGTQQVFYTDPNVLYISLHRHDDGNFFPGSGAPEEVGSGPGLGFNVNVAWTRSLDPPIGDVEYLTAFRTVVMPIAKEFSPDVVLVSAGFDAVEGHSPQLGGYKVSAKCFGHLTRQLMSLAGGKIVLALEGGHSLTAICDAAECCVSALLGKELEPLPQHLLHQKPNENGVASLARVLQVQGRYWGCTRHLSHTLALSLSQALGQEPEENEAVAAIASLGLTSAAGTEGRSRDEPMEDQMLA